MKKFLSVNNIITICYFTLYLLIGISLLTKQPIGNPPDEYNRYLIPEYIVNHGTLPTGYEEEIRIYGYGFSYGFQPMLPYMLQGYTMRFVDLFTDSADVLFYTGRIVNFILGFLMAIVVLKLSKEWFTDSRLRWTFAFLVTFLPQSIFIHTYINTDSCCMLSIAVMLLGLTRGIKTNFSPKTSVIMSIGIILCALSYYNAYGYILSCILLFISNFCCYSQKKFVIRYKELLSKGFFISAIVLLGISWWFIRSAILYNGDFLGLKTREECGLLYALPEYHPDTRVTWESQGFSLWDMITKSDFFTLSIMSFIGVFGAMTVTTSIWVYRFYKALFFVGILLALFLPVKYTNAEKSLYSKRKWFSSFYHINMIFCILMPLFLSLYYSFHTDYQPQGRYILPALIPLCYYTVRGLEKLCNLSFLHTKHKNRIITAVSVMIPVLITVLLLVTVYGYAFPYYTANPDPYYWPN